mgnify:CR=1 FL=1
MKTSNIILLAVVAVFLVVLAINFSANASIYTDFAHAKESGRQVHIVGEWVNREQSSYDPSRDLFTFYLRDTLQRVERVHYYDPKPSNFEQAERVVVIGGYKNDQFIAEQIVMKCPSKYEETDITAGEKVSQ